MTNKECEHKYPSVVPLRNENTTILICGDCGFTWKKTKKQKTKVKK